MVFEQELPTYFVLRNAKNKYLQYINKGRFPGQLEFSGDEAISAYTKHEFVPATNDTEKNAGLFHIRCCFNNKLWRLNTVDHQEVVVATENEPEEEGSTSCTLFTAEGEFKKFSLVHSSTKNFVSLHAGGSEPGVLFARPPPGDVEDITFELIDWDSFVILPEMVMFKGDNDRYLTVRYKEGDRPYLQFDSTLDDVNQSPTLVLFRVYNTPDGNVRIKSESNSKFWHLNLRWIWADSMEKLFQISNSDSVFRVVNSGRNDYEVGIYSLGNEKFCQRLTKEGKEDCLHAEAATMEVEAAILKVEEPVVSRKIFNIVFHTEEARFYDERVVSILKKEFANPMQEFTHRTTMNDTYTTSITTTWKANTVSPISITNFSVDNAVHVKKNDEGELELVVTEWHQEGLHYKVANTETLDETLTYEITIPAGSTVTRTVLATEIKYDVPYSYKQEDTLIGGRKVIYEKHDGMYSGSNCYDFRVTDPEV